MIMLLTSQISQGSRAKTAENTLDMKIIIAILAAFLAISCASEPKLEQQPLENSVVYEMNVRQYTPEGTFAAAQKELPRLAEMGVDIVWLMPIYPIGVEGRKGTLGSYYAVKDYCAVNPEFGTLEDFDNFVAEAHRLGLRVVIDWVANHTSPDAVWESGRTGTSVMRKETQHSRQTGLTLQTSIMRTRMSGPECRLPSVSGWSVASTDSAATWHARCRSSSGRRLFQASVRTILKCTGLQKAKSLFSTVCQASMRHTLGNFII